MAATPSATANARDGRTRPRGARTDTLGELAAELRFSVARLSRRLRSERHPDNELSVGALSVLAMLYLEGECTIGALAASERVQPPSMTRTVNCLVEGGYAVRRPCATDGRQVLVDITDRGREVLATNRKLRNQWLAQRLRELSPEERDLLRGAAPILKKLAQS